MKYLAKIAALLVGLVVTLGVLGAHAEAVAPTTLTATWATTSDPSKPLPTDASNVAWPQTLLSPVPACMGTATVVQVDAYDYTGAHKAAVDALLAHGTLNAPGSSTWTDSAFVLSWSYRVIPACHVPTAISTTTTTPPTVTTTPPTVTTTPPASSPVIPSAKPTAPTSAAPVHTSASATPSALAVVPSVSGTPDPLANTGARTGVPLVIGCILFLLGVAALVGARRLGARH